MPLAKITDEVYVADESIVRLGPADVAFIAEQAHRSPRRRARICAHRSDADTLHEMIIAIARDSYIHPHRHHGKSESFHIIEGMVDVVVLDEAGAVAEVVELGDPTTGRPFFYRLADPRFHTLLIRTPHLVVHEVTSGPFDRRATDNAAFAPPESEREAAARYLEVLAAQVAARRSAAAP